MARQGGIQTKKYEAFPYDVFEKGSNAAFRPIILKSSQYSLFRNQNFKSRVEAFWRGGLVCRIHFFPKLRTKNQIRRS